MAIASVSIKLESCAAEPIHVPGSIQPHGMMLVADRRSLVVRHVAGDVEQRLGAVEWEDQELSTLIGETLSARVAVLLKPEFGSSFLGQLPVSSGRTLDVSAHSSGQYLIVELEPASADPPSASLVLDTLSGAAGGFEQSESISQLCGRAAVEFRLLTGFDRVMVYQFLDDGAGQVVAEDRREDMHSFFNHHFPESDIPRQARALYVRNLVRVIPDVGYLPASLRPRWSAQMPLDMSDSVLRSVSPVHLQYLTNMNVRGSASFSIVTDGVLWGLIACHHETPRLLTYDIRVAGRALAGTLARQIKAMDEAGGYRQRIRLRSFEDDVVGVLSQASVFDEALNNHLNYLGRMMSCDGVAVLRGTELVTNGACPDEDDIRAFATWLLACTDPPIFSTNHLSSSYQRAAAFQHRGSGVLAATLSADEPWLLLWFRVEQIETVNWAGNPHKSDSENTLQALTPRASFHAWQETVRGRAPAWTLPEIDAARRLRVALLDIQQNRQVQELNRQLIRTLREKDLILQQNKFLIREVNHRVQNSLEIVSTFLALQARIADNPELIATLKETRGRVSAVALVHRRLYRDGQIKLVDAALYMEELCADTLAFMGRDWAQHLSLSVSFSMTISADRAVTLGLLLTELLINVNKHAYDGRVGPIEIELIEETALLRLTVADRGVGEVSHSKGFGLLIIRGLAAQLGGTFAYSDNNPGLRIVITIPSGDAPPPG